MPAVGLPGPASPEPPQSPTHLKHAYTHTHTHTHTHTLTLNNSYNAESTFYGAFSSNHPAQADSYWNFILDWRQGARILAQEQAALYGLQCPNKTLHYPCHLAPWGYQSWDQTTYMHWVRWFLLTG